MEAVLISTTTQINELSEQKKKVELEIATLRAKEQVSDAEGIATESGSLDSF